MRNKPSVQSAMSNTNRPQVASRVAFIYDRSNTELLALLLKQSMKEYGVTNTIGNKRIADGPLQELDLSQLRAAPAFLQALSSPPASKVATVS
jgi:hypothetical protein